MSTRHGGKGGAIVNVSSMASKLGSPGEYVDYAASKGAIDSLTIGLAREVAEEGIRVNAVRPGVIYTEIHASGGEPGRVDRVKAAVPMKRGGEPGGGRARDPVAPLRRGVVLDRRLHRRFGRPLKWPATRSRRERRSGHRSGGD